MRSLALYSLSGQWHGRGAPKLAYLRLQEDRDIFHLPCLDAFSSSSLATIEISCPVMLSVDLDNYVMQRKFERWKTLKSIHLRDLDPQPEEAWSPLIARALQAGIQMVVTTSEDESDRWSESDLALDVIEESVVVGSDYASLNALRPPWLHKVRFVACL